MKTTLKKILLCVGFITVSATSFAQVDKGQSGSSQEELDDRLQQEPPREPQQSIDAAARQADVNAKSNQNERSAEEKMREERERSTGKEIKNPAEENPKTVKPVRLSDPVSAPPNSGNR